MSPPVLTRQNAMLKIEIPDDDEVTTTVVPPVPVNSPVSEPEPEEEEYSLAVVEDVFNAELERVKRQEEERERQTDELMKKMKADYERKMSELLEEKQRVDEMLEKKKNELEIKNQIQKNELEIKKIKRNSQDKKRSSVFTRLSNGGSSVEKRSLLKDQLRRSS